MSETILVTGGKGGTGKSCISNFLCRALANKGNNVLLLELDSGLRGMDIMLGVSDKVVYDISDVLTYVCKPAKAIIEVPTEKGHFHFIAAPNDRYFRAESGNLKLLIRGLSSIYDYVIIDSAAGLGKAFDDAATVSDRALVITTVDPITIRDAEKVGDNLSCPARLVINKFHPSFLKGEFKTIDDIIDKTKIQLIGVIPVDGMVVSSICSGESLPRNSIARLQISDLARRIDGERIPLNTRRLK